MQRHLNRAASSTPFSGNHLWEKSSHGETAIVDMLQVCVPFATDANGQTVYEKMGEEKFLLVEGNYHFNTNLPASFYANSEVATCAKGLIYLVENKLMTL